MSWGLRIALFVAEAVMWGLALRYYLYIFQQNSYRHERFMRWLRGNRGLLPRLFFRTSKVGFKMTPRMLRLTVTASLLFAAAAAWSPIAGVVVLALCWAFMLLADYINSPLEKGINRRYYREAERMLRERPDLVIIGITGSYGKTSTKNYLHRMLSERYNVLITPGNFNTTLGVVRTVREQLKPWHQVFIVEMGARQKGDIAEICELVHPTIGIVTAVGPMHLETFGSIDGVLQTKLELIQALPADGLGIINAESAPLAAWDGSGAACKVLRYGIDAHRADWRAAGIACTAAGTSFDAIGPKGSVQLHTSLFGEGNVLDILGALVAAEQLGVTPLQQKMAVAKLSGVVHRLSVSRRGGITVIDDAYNSNPEGARMALDLLRAMPCDGRRIVVTPGFVEMGDRQHEAAVALGRDAAQRADRLVIVNLLNREAIRSGALAAGMPESSIVLADTLQDAVAALPGLCIGGDVVLYENDLPDIFK